MSFTQDELQVLNALFDQKMMVLRRELERTFDQRMQTLRREFEQQVASTLQDALRGLVRRFLEQQHKLRDSILQRINQQHEAMQHTLTDMYPQRQQQLEDNIDRSLAAQLLAIEQLINHHFSSAATDIQVLSPAQSSATNFDAIEVQTEIPWDDLIDLLNNALNERFATFNTTLQTRLREVEREVALQVQTLRDDLHREHSSPLSSPSSFGGSRQTNVNLQEILASVNQLERVVESMQMAMTANSTLLSNRLYHHQRLPMERAHPTNTSTSSRADSERSGGNDWPRSSTGPLSDDAEI